jgi:GntR family transcriptional regulator, transcriptional repressor for pyruvate dehydrogenase complex
MASQELAAGREETQPTAAEHVAESLARIVLGEMAPGASIPSEAELATRFSVSRLTVREAVKMLAGRGLLHLGRGRRAVVREPNSSAFADFLVSIISNDPKGLFDLIELRMMLETQSASLAAKRTSRAGLLAIESAMKGMQDTAIEIETSTDPVSAEFRFHDFDVQFHEAIATASGNRVISFVFEAMAKPLRESFFMSGRGQRLRGNDRGTTLNAHQAILDAIRAGDQRGAAEAMRKHLRETEIDIRAHMANRTEPQ